MVLQVMLKLTHTSKAPPQSLGLPRCHGRCRGVHRGARGCGAEPALALQGEPGQPGAVGCPGVNGSQVGLSCCPHFAVGGFSSCCTHPIPPLLSPQGEMGPSGSPGPRGPQVRGYVTAPGDLGCPEGHPAGRGLLQLDCGLNPLQNLQRG